MSIPEDTFVPASADDVCDNCSRTRAEHKSSICVTGGFCKFPVKQTKATFSVQERHHDYLLQVERRGRALLAHAKEQGGLGDQVEDCRYILEGEGLWKDVLE